MRSFQNIEASAQKIIEICGKSQLKKSDKDRLLKLQAEMHTSIENLLECEICGCIVSFLVEIKIGNVSAKTCRDCGIKALEAGEIKKTPSRRRSSTTYNSTTGAKRTNNTKSEKKVQRLIKRVHGLIDGDIRFKSATQAYKCRPCRFFDVCEKRVEP